MAKFKVGDRVSFTSPKGTPLTGVVIEPDEWTPRSNFLIVVDPEFGYHTPRVERRSSALALIEPAAPKPKTIPARSLSGKHIGRVVTITTRDGIQISSALTLVRHLEGGVAVELKGVKAPGFTGAPFYLDPESEVIVK